LLNEKIPITPVITSAAPIYLARKPSATGMEEARRWDFW